MRRKSRGKQAQFFLAISGLHLAAGLALVLGLTSCGTSAPAEKQLPTMVGRVSSEGRGYPYGRSDEEPYVHLEELATDDQYGYTPEKPVKVAGLTLEGVTSGPQKEKAFLNSLRGPQGQVIEYERLGSCCPVESQNSPWGMALLDVFAITWEGAKEPVVLYLNFYDAGELLVPKGFTPRP